MKSEDLLIQWCRFGWKFRQIGRRPKAEQEWYAARVKYELDLMISKDLADFFLATSDMVRWAKDKGILVGPGRGSVAASVVSWFLRITEVDPIRYPSLLFERFIDVTRTDPPDIDLDFEDERRHEVFEYMAQRYGAECVGSVANFIRYRAKNSLVDVARVYQIPHGAKQAVSDLIVERSGGDSRFDSSLQDTVEMFPTAAKIFEVFPDLWKATSLEGNVRGMSIHAAGMIVANSPLTDICAVYERDGRAVLSIDKYDVEYAGALKMDCLGLTTMGMIARCLEMTGLTLDDLYDIPDDDPGALAVFKKGDVTGIFQFEGRATRLVNRDVSPDNFFEVVDINALSRPGPLFSGTTAEYCDVKHGRRDPERYHDLVDEITKYTRGQLIYQEQILRTVREVGGFDWTNANEIRRIIAKKIGEAAFNVSMGNFIDGAARLHGIKEETARRIWKRLVTSGTYAFVYAHSVSYSIIGLWCAWLKAHYPLEFYAASLARAGDEEQQFKLLKDAEQHGIGIRPPIVGVSKATWAPRYSKGGAIGYEDGKFTSGTIRTGEVIAGYQQIPGIGEVMAKRIYDDKDGFLFWDDLQRVPGIGPKKVLAMQAFAEQKDPFGLRVTENRLASVRAWLKTQNHIPKPTHTGTEIAAIYMEQNFGDDAKRTYGEGPEVIYMGIVKTRNMQDIVENRRSRTGEEAADILKTLKRPDLLEYCSLRCFDTTDEEVYLRVNRFTFPRLKRTVEKLAVNHDVVVAVGNRIAGFGTPVMVNKLWVIDPD